MQVKLFHTARDLKGLLKIFKVSPHAEDLVCQPILGRDGGNIGNVLSPHDVRLMKDIKLRKKEAMYSSLLLLCIAVLLAATNTSSRARLRRGGCSVLAVILGEKAIVDVTEKN